MKILLLFTIIFCASLIFIIQPVFANDTTTSGPFLKGCEEGKTKIPTLEPPSDNTSGPKQGILVMQPNSVAMVCIKYVKPSGWQSSIDINNTKLNHPLMTTVENVHVSGSLVSFGSIFVNNVVITKAQPNIISFGSQKNASTVILYTISAKSDSKGYYHLSIPYMCGDILLAVGYNPSQVDASAFQDTNTMCFNFGVKVSIVGISGANMTYVGISHETIHSTKLPENISIIPPLQQVKSFDTSAKSVQCNTGLQLVIKSEDGSPACVKPDTAQKLIERGWTIDANPLANYTGIVSMGNRTYYFETPHYSHDVYFNSTQISFHGVTFTLFPIGFRGGLPIPCNNNPASYQYYWTDAKFADGADDLLHIQVTSPPCTTIPSMFSNHTNPQAGLTVYDGKMKLLVSTDKTTEKNAAPANPLGVTALVIYHPSLGCLGPCPPNNFYLKANSNSSAYLLGYDICDKGTCVKNNTLSVPLPANSVIKPQYARVWLPKDIEWKDGDTVHIQLDVSPVPDSKAATLLDLGNSTIVP